ncbi:MAG: hypothetical protein U5K56_11440 [Halioglobus sp.]|nr:hypothetical protein [Halioglobus sp.]
MQQIGASSIDADDVPELARRDKDTGSSNETGDHGTGEEVGQQAKPQHPPQQQHAP